MEWNKNDPERRGNSLSVYNKKSKLTYDIKFTIVENKFSCLLGLKTLKNLGFVIINGDQFLANVRTGTCDLGVPGELALTTDPTKKPRQVPCRKEPFAVNERVQTEIEKLVQRGISVPVTEPTGRV